MTYKSFFYAQFHIAPRLTLREALRFRPGILLLVYTDGSGFGFCVKMVMISAKITPITIPPIIPKISIEVGDMNIAANSIA